MSFIWFLILDFEDPWFKSILKAQIMYLREIYKNFPQKKKKRRFIKKIINNSNQENLQIEA